MTVTLRPAEVSDIEFFFQLQQDPVAVRMAAFTSANLSDREAFEARWRRVLSEPDVVVKTVLVGSAPVGQVLTYVAEDDPQVSYWIAREHWGHGYATEALRLLLLETPQRPVFGRAAQDNVGSLAVLQHNGFAITDEDVGPAAGRGEMVKEYVLTLTS